MEQLQERVNINVAMKLSKLTYLQFKHLVNKSTTKKPNKFKEEKDYKANYTSIIKYTKAIIEANNKLEVSYGFTEYKDQGRLQAKTQSLQRIFNGFRGILSEGITYDLDMSNCHPNILINLCKSNKIENKYLMEYVTNRDQWLEELRLDHKISRAEAKMYFLKCLNKEDLTIKINNKMY